MFHCKILPVSFFSVRLVPSSTSAPFFSKATFFGTQSSRAWNSQNLESAIESQAHGFSIPR
ncbi:hypothetical protein SDJN02_18337 [Cucurbita argyrosperma subsp. argyrosperma]|nr:hypothetical protein SDJN02_18337 [Cucurbita argyrosperma subsp. argyrosperma]